MNASAVPGRAVPGLAVPGYHGGAPVAVNAFTIAFTCGDNTSATQAFAPAGWTTLPAVTASNGVDHSCDVVLTAAWTVTSSAVSVTGTAGTAEDLSGAIIGVQVDAPSPIPAVSGVSPGWAGRTILQAALGSGFQTPADEMTWTTLSDSAAAPGSIKRLWSWSETSTGIPYALGQLQSSEGTVEIDNADGEVTPSNAASAYFPDVTTGTPLRMLFALGTYGGVPVDRWYCWQRNALDWTEKRDESLRNYVETGLTDGWSVVGASCPTPYRGEVLQDGPYAWWPMDDQPLSGGVLPTALLNAAPGNSSTLNVLANSVTAGDQYSTTGTDLTTDGTVLTGIPAGNPPPSVAVYGAGTNPGWMYGDPQSSPSSYSTGNPVTSSPGSAAWQQTGLLGNTGANGWFLAANDTGFPPLSGGMTFGLWFNATFFGTATGFTDTGNSTFNVAGQPYGQITLATLATASNAVAILYLDISGHLILETFAGSTGTTHSIYSSSDLRSSSFHSVKIALTTTTWTVYVDGGQTALVSGTAAGMTSAWTWLILGADCGTAGGSSLGSAVHMSNIALSHAEVYPGLLPAWRELSHYAAATTGFGTIPAPQSVAVSTVGNQLAGVGYVPDGSEFRGSYGSSGSAATAFGFSALVTAGIGSYSSGPSARSTIAAIGGNTGGTIVGKASWVSWTSLAPQSVVYTAASANAETSAGTADGSGLAFTAGYGGSATAAGVCKTGGGAGASPPTGPDALGDTVANRLERILSYGGVTSPNRAIDATASALVQAALDVGGQQAGASIASIVSSDYGMLFVDSNGTTCYKSRPHLSSDTVVWNISSAGPDYGYPYSKDQNFGNDPQFVYNVIQVNQYSPDGASLPATTPANASAATASQSQYGPRPLSVGTTSYLQSTALIQSAVNWLLSTFGALERRVLTATVDAAGYPPAWPYVLSVQCGDLLQITDQPMQGGPLSVGTYRVSLISRKVAFGANGSKPTGAVTVTCDPVPASYF